MALTITRDEAVDVLNAIGFRTKKDSPIKELEKKICKLPEVVDDSTADEMDDQDAELVFRDIMIALKKEEDIEIIEGDDSSGGDDAADSEKSDGDDDFFTEAEAEAAAEESAEKQKETKAKNGKKKKGKKAKKQKSDNELETASGDKPEKKMSQIKAAIKVLEEEGEPLTCKRMVELMSERGYWKPGKGKTPAATLNATIRGDMKKESPRFQRVDRGLYALV